MIEEILKKRGHSNPKSGVKKIASFTAGGGQELLNDEELRFEMVKIWEGAAESYNTVDVEGYYDEHIRAIRQFIRALRSGGNVRGAFKGVMRTAETVKEPGSHAVFHYDPMSAAGYMDSDIERWAQRKGIKADFAWYQVMQYLTM